MRISDWSSDVCSSDLTLDLYAAKARAAFVKAAGLELGEAEDVLKHDLGRVLLKLEECQEAEIAAALAPEDRAAMSAAERAEAIDRKSVVEGKGVSVRGELGGRRSLKKKKKKRL